MKSQALTEDTRMPLPKSGEHVYCPCCKGKGHVFDSFILLFLLFPIVGVLFLFMACFEFNNPNGMSREECGRCNGKGFVKVPS